MPGPKCSIRERRVRALMVQWWAASFLSNLAWTGDLGSKESRCVAVIPFLQNIFAVKRLFFPGPSSIATSHLSIVVTLSRFPGSPPVRVRKTDNSACDAC